MNYWDKLKGFQPYSFMLNASGGVARVADSTGAWLERHKVQELVDAADTELAASQAEVARLRTALESALYETTEGNVAAILEAALK